MSAANLRAWLATEIATKGPITVERYMRECLMHPEFGYYRRRQAIGAAGDFITAPEISQIFGELIGIWTAAAWAGLGEPKRWRLIELGPGRGTLMSDLLRALKVLPAARAGVEVVLVEGNAVLREQQRAALEGCGVPVAWADETFPSGLDWPELPTIVIGNEFLDALPIRQLVAVHGKWHERCVDVAVPTPRSAASFETRPPGAQDEVKGLGEGTVPSFQFVDTPDPVPATYPEVSIAHEGAVYEVMSSAAEYIGAVSLALGEIPSYMLFIDYGHEGPLPGDTLQAVSGHRYADPLAAPGEHDLSAQVDFSQVRDAASRLNFEAYGPITQAEFLGWLGGAERLQRLTRGKDAATVQAMQSGLARLMQPDGMGGRFKAIVLARKGVARPPVF